MYRKTPYLDRWFQLFSIHWFSQPGRTKHATAPLEEVSTSNCCIFCCIHVGLFMSIHLPYPKNKHINKRDGCWMVICSVWCLTLTTSGGWVMSYWLCRDSFLTRLSNRNLPRFPKPDRLTTIGLVQGKTGEMFFYRCLSSNTLASATLHTDRTDTTTWRSSFAVLGSDPIDEPVLTALNQQDASTMPCSLRRAPPSWAAAHLDPGAFPYTRCRKIGRWCWWSSATHHVWKRASRAKWSWCEIAPPLACSRTKKVCRFSLQPVLEDRDARTGTCWKSLQHHIVIIVSSSSLQMGLSENSGPLKDTMFRMVPST